MQKFYKKTAIAFLLFGAIGFVDAVYLTIEHFLGEIPPCAISGCEFVLTSAYSEIFGVPVALLGSIYYALILILSIAYLDLKREKLLKYISYFSIVGFLSSIYFVYLQFFVIDYVCQYCMVSAFVCFVTFIFSMHTIYTLNKDKVLKDFTI